MLVDFHYVCAYMYTRLFQNLFHKVFLSLICKRFVRQKFSAIRYILKGFYAICDASLKRSRHS